MTIFLLCPPRYATGGIELLHQYCKAIRENGVESFIWYKGYEGDDLTPSDYLEYENDCYCGEELPDDAIVLLPEIYADIAGQFERAAICWESVDNYVIRFGKEAPKIPVMNIWQSYYSYGFLKLQGIKDLFHITDYINDAYTADYEETIREDIVLYNPAKGYDITKRIMVQCSGIQFIPIKGMKRAEIISLMRKSKLWIDFGGHPGKDRLPREAAACGMNIITGRNGGAKNPYDIYIPEIYKVDGGNIEDAAALIKMSLKNYSRYKSDYNPYRDVIRKEKEDCYAGIKEFVHEIQHRYPSL